MDTDKLVLAAVFDHAPAANIAAGMLRANGIPCILDNEINHQILGIQLVPNNGIRLMVRAADLDAAHSLLASHGDL